MNHRDMCFYTFPGEKQHKLIKVGGKTTAKNLLVAS